MHSLDVLHTGVQNTILALAIVTLSFNGKVPASDYLRMQVLVLLWGLIVSVEAAIAMLAFRYAIGRLGADNAVVVHEDPPDQEVTVDKLAC
jgi:hypothetical protein